MKQIIKLLVVIGVLIVSPMHLLASSYVSGQLIIKPIDGAYTQPNTLETELSECLSTTNFMLSKRQISFKPGQNNNMIYILTLGDTEADMEQVAGELERKLSIEYAEPNYIVESQSHPFIVDDDSEKSKVIEYDMRYIAYIPTQREVIVAVVDTGVDYTHDYLAHAIWKNEGEIPDNGIDDDGNGFIDDWQGWDFTDYATTGGDNDPKNVTNTTPFIVDHATMIAGIYTASKMDRQNIRGITSGVKIMNLKRKSADISNVYDASVAMRYATDMGANIINCSFSNGNDSQFLGDATKYAYDHGVLVVAAAGNNGITNSLYPANSEYAIAVGMYSYNENALNDKSSRGDFVDFAAMGNVISTTVGNGTGGGSGTSYATPIIGSVAAQIWMNDPTLSREDVINKMIEYSAVLDDGGTESGYGKILYKELAESYVDISTYNIQADVEGDIVTFECEVVRQGAEVLHTVLNYMYYDGARFSIHKELQ